MNQNIDSILAEQSNQLDKERQRLSEDLNSLNISNGSGDTVNHATNEGESPEPDSVRVHSSCLDAEKQQKEDLNQAISDQRSESNPSEPPRTGRRFVRPQVNHIIRTMR